MKIWTECAKSVLPFLRFADQEVAEGADALGLAQRVAIDEMHVESGPFDLGQHPHECSSFGGDIVGQRGDAQARFRRLQDAGDVVDAERAARQCRGSSLIVCVRSQLSRGSRRGGLAIDDE